VTRAKQVGTYQVRLDLTSGQTFYNPPLFQGMAGIGYQLLRLARPDEVPSLLLFDYSSYTGLFLVRDRSAEGHFYAGEGALRDLIASEHAAHQRGRKETLPKLFVLDLLREHP
jgi:hypothetical protein